MYEFKDKGNDAYSYKATKIELIDESTNSNKELAAISALSSARKLRVAKLLQGVEKSYDKGKLLLDESEDFVENEQESNLDFADSESLFSKAYTEEEQEESYFDGEMRFSKVTDKELLDELNNGKTIKVYRAMQMVDGKLYPPMSGVLKGKMQEPIEADTWYQSDEHPDLVEWRDNTWKFPLQKNKKGGKM